MHHHFNVTFKYFAQDTLRDMRVVDDKIVYALNTSIPTESFSAKVDVHATCKDLFHQVHALYTAKCSW